MDTINVIYVEPGKEARVIEMKDELSEMQKLVGGYIEEYMPFEDDVALICNDEGKILGLPLNRSIKDGDGSVTEVIAGSFFICDCSTDEFGSLSQEQLDKYTEMFKNPEEFYRVAGAILAVPYTPTTPGAER